MTGSFTRIKGSLTIGDTISFNSTFVGQTFSRQSESTSRTLTINELDTSNWLLLAQHGENCAIYYIWWHGHKGYKYSVYDSVSSSIVISINNQQLKIWGTRSTLHYSITRLK